MLRPDTEKLWGRLRDERALSGFVLVGGTALSMHINHRLSEDLDFMFLDKELPTKRLSALRRQLANEGIDLVPNDSPAEVESFNESGLNYADYQRDYLAGKVKITFVAPEPENAKQLESVESPGPRVAGLREIFGLKCIVAADRSKSRDWFDLYTLLKSGAFQPIDIYRAFVRSQAPAKFEIAMMRLCSGKPSVTDEGYESLLGKPPTLEEMAEYFKGVRKAAEMAIAREELGEVLLSAPMTNSPGNQAGKASSGPAPRKSKRP